MGSPVTPNYANLFMGNFLLDFTKIIPSLCSKCYWKYTDDLFFVWSENSENTILIKKSVKHLRR